MKSIVKKYYKPVLAIALLLLLLIVWANIRISNSVKEYIKNNVAELPECKAGLLLGTSKFLRSGLPNEYFYNRINAAVELFKSGKIKYIIVSGDNSIKEYNEPLDMKNELIKNGVPDSLIYLDYAGFRTFDSVIRAKEIFGQSSYIIISQEFHNQRAVYIARHYDIEAYGYNAKDVSAYMGFKTRMREYFARVKVFVDIILGNEPKFLGEKILLGSASVKSVKVFLKNISDSLNVIIADSYSGEKRILSSTWKLEYPVFHFELGDANNDSIDDILVGVVKATRFDSIVRKRIFIFKLFEGYIRPLWLGSRVSQPLEDFCLVKTPEQNIIRTVEKEKNGNYLVAEYRWRGFGLDFIHYLKRDINLKSALANLKKSTV